MAPRSKQSIVLAPTFLADLGPRIKPQRCAVPGCRSMKGIPREEAKGQPICPDCYHKRATEKLFEVAKAKLFAWLAGR